MKLYLYILLLCLLVTQFIACKKTTSTPSDIFMYASAFNISRFGAVGDGHTMNTHAIQLAIDSCARSGGGIVVVPEGNFLTGTIYLKSKVWLYIGERGVLTGSSHIVDYPVNTSRYLQGKNYALIFAQDAQQIAVTGPGTIEGQGGSPDFNTGTDESNRPRLIFFMHCQNININGVSLRNSAHWVQYYFYCRDVHINSINVYSYANLNNDGLDIDAQDVTVSDCHIQSGDDGICLKSNAPVPCSNVQINNCTVASDCNSIKLGSGSSTGFININIQNCVITKPPVSPFYQWPMVFTGITEHPSSISGLALEMVDGGLMDQVNISHINMTGVQTPLFIKLGDRSRQNPNRSPGKLQNITISDVHAVSVSKMSSSITGFPGNYVQNVLLKNISFTCPGYGNAADTTRPVPDNKSDYPESHMFGSSLPAYGLYIRHATQINLQNVSLSFSTSDIRPAIVVDDVKNATGSGLNLKAPSRGVEPVKMINSSDIIF